MNQIIRVKLCSTILIAIISLQVNTQKEVYFELQNFSSLLHIVLVAGMNVYVYNVLKNSVIRFKPKISTIFNSAKERKFLILEERQDVEYSPTRLYSKISKKINRKLLINPVINNQKNIFKLTVFQGVVTHFIIVFSEIVDQNLKIFMDLLAYINICGKKDDIIVILEKNKKVTENTSKLNHQTCLIRPTITRIQTI